MTLKWKAYPAGQNGFFRAPVLVWGKTSAILIDGGFTLSDGRAIAEDIKSKGVSLEIIYVSQSDPDYYFSLEAITAAFPSAKVLAAPDTIAAIKASVEKKLATWGPQLGENGPKNVVIPEPFTGKSFMLEGESVDIVTLPKIKKKQYVWVPSLGAMFGGVLAFNGLHVWTADTPIEEKMLAWISTLEKIKASKPKIVVAGHMQVGADTSGGALDYTMTYLKTFIKEMNAAKDSSALVTAMKAHYPKSEMDVALNIGAKVVKGEMKWG
ncbi:MAG: MBL fold metallo-hydrolase [Pseudomonadota bacterium]|nr:MBL fold metallo-hydrolase [Pseudomonadota bacterium]